MRKEDKFRYLYHSGAEGYSDSELYIDTLKGIIYAGEKDMQRYCIGHLARNIGNEKGGLSLKAMKNILMDTDSVEVDDDVIREIIKKLVSIHSRLSLTDMPYSSLFADALKFGAINLGVLNEDAAFLVIKAIRKIKAFSNRNKWSKDIDSFISDSSGRKEIVVITDVSNKYDFNFNWKRNEVWGQEFKVKDLDLSSSRLIGRQLEGQGYLIILRLKNFLKEYETNNEPEFLKKQGFSQDIYNDIAADFVLYVLTHELDHIKTDEIDRNRDFFSNSLQQFVNEKHAYLLVFDIIKKLSDRYNDLFSFDFWKKEFMGTDTEFPNPDEHKIASVKYKGLSKLEEWIIDAYKLDAKEVLSAISQADQGGSIYSQEDLEFEDNDWIPSFRLNSQLSERSISIPGGLISLGAIEGLDKSDTGVGGLPARQDEATIEAGGNRPDEKIGQCVTGDTLLPIVSGDERKTRDERRWTKDEEQYILKPIVKVKAGEYVLSLNEATQAIEPHRINGLLDMGVKPVYKLTTASGRSIKTTANHPYLVKTGFRVQGAEVKKRLNNNR